MILKIKFFLLNFTIVKKFLSIIYNLINSKVKIFKKNNLWIHQFEDKYLINFHPILNFTKFKNIYNFFCKKYTPKKNDIIIDVGSGLGQELLYFSRKIGNKGKVFAIESDPRLFKVLNEIILLNDLKNVYLFNSFFYKKNNLKVKSRLHPTNEWMSNSIYSSKGKFFKTKTITIDSIIKKHNLKKINFAKFNIEGSEVNLLSGNDNFLKQCQNICISCHDFINKKEYKTFHKVKRILEKKNFKIQKNLSKNNIQKYFIYAKKK